jgi:hypothetical protein
VVTLLVVTATVPIVCKLAALSFAAVRSSGAGPIALLPNFGVSDRDIAMRAGRRMSLHRRATMAPLSERALNYWRWRADDYRGATGDTSSLLPSSPKEPAGAVEGRRRSPASHGTYRTVCVRLCDGYYFPLSFSVSRSQFARDAQVCKSRCGSESRLYVQRNPGDVVEDMKDLKGRSYGKLEAAFRYRSEYLANCKCQPHPWETEAAERHRVYGLAAAAASGDKEAAMELLALQSTSRQPSENGKVVQTERSSHRLAPTSERSKRKSRNTSDNDQRPPEHHWREMIFRSSN